MLGFRLVNLEGAPHPCVAAAGRYLDKMASKHSYNGKCGCGGGGGGSGPPPPKKPKTEPRPRGPKCNLCKGFGHIKKFCPKNAGQQPSPVAAPPPPVAPHSPAKRRSNVERLLAECEQRPAPKRRMSI
ncbi:hypothetical protein KC315_g11030 [Hortaea werneckii]|nr:hypothetical protein KC315_g11030 [Hortaea werneckii]